MSRRGSELLSHIPMFAGLTQRQLRRIRMAMEEYDFEPGHVLVSEGSHGQTFFVIVHGQAKVVRRTRTVARLLPGDFFGELSVLDGGPRTASVVAETPLRCLTLLRKEFLGILTGEPGVAAGILRVMARRLRRLEHPLTG